MNARERAAHLESLGFPLPLIADRVGVSKSTIYRWLRPDYAAKSRRWSREAKQRRTGTCEDCGAETRYNGRTTHGASSLCLRCAQRRDAERRTVWTRARIIAAIQEWARLYGEPPAMADWNPWACEHELGDYDRPARYEAGDWPTCSWVVRRFGRWNDAIAAAGFQPRAAHGGGGNASRRRRRSAA